MESNNSTNSFDDIVNNASSQGAQSTAPATSNNPTWKLHGAYLLTIKTWRFFVGPAKARPIKFKDSRFKFIAEQLISALPENPDKTIIESTENLLRQHRTIEDTEARRRLERWACHIIVMYLVFVFILLILNGISRIIWSDIFTDGGFISDTVMYVILSTTTVNIIGLGLIVLRGHFPVMKDKEQEHQS